MKNQLLLLLFLLSGISVFAQEPKADSSTKELKNVLSIDATGLVAQFLNFSPNGYYYSGYYLTYRRILKSNCIKAGFLWSNRSEDSFENDTLSGSGKNNRITVAVGFEHYAFLTPRWSLYFGGDVLWERWENESFSVYSDSTTGLRNTNRNGYGFAPLLGIRFKLNKRMSLSSETSIAIMREKGEDILVNNPTNQYDYHKKYNGYTTQFNAPLGVSFRVLF